MNKPLREAIEKIVRQGFGEPVLIMEDQIMQLIRTTLTKLEAEMPIEKTRSKDLDDIVKHELFQFDHNPSMQRLIAIGRINAHNNAVQQQQAAFKKVLEEMK